jgi:hypothetical protein
MNTWLWSEDVNKKDHLEEADDDTCTEMNLREKDMRV